LGKILEKWKSFKKSLEPIKSEIQDVRIILGEIGTKAAKFEKEYDPLGLKDFEFEAGLDIFGKESKRKKSKRKKKRR